MSSLISIIVWVIIMLAVSGVLKGKKRGGGSAQNPYYKNNTPPPAPPAYTPPPVPPVYVQPPSTPQPSRQPVVRETQAAAGTQVKTGTGRPGMTNYPAGTAPEKNKKEGIKNAAYSAVQKKEEESDMSTTDYLRQKAVLDEAGHRQEKRQEDQRARWETGGLPAAKRLIEGDSVPQGMRRVACSYCGADNLVPQGSRQRYTCYFCREELE